MAEQAEDGLLVGADKIASFLKIKRRQVYAMREAGHPLIKNEPGLGICASKAALRDHFHGGRPA